MSLFWVTCGWGIHFWAYFAHFLSSMCPPDAVLSSGSSHALICGQNNIEGYVMHLSGIMWSWGIHFCSYFHIFNNSGIQYGRRTADSILVIIIFWTRHIEWCKAGLSCMIWGGRFICIATLSRLYVLFKYSTAILCQHLRYDIFVSRQILDQKIMLLKISFSIFVSM